MDERKSSFMNIMGASSNGSDEGTIRDQQDMQRIGRSQELRRNFGLPSIVGLTAVLMGTWEAMFYTASYAIPNGGLAGMIYLYIIALAGLSLVILSMAEMASMAPTSGGQYHWVSEFAPRKLQKFLSFQVGWLSILAWQSGTASQSYFVALQLQGIIGLNDDTYKGPPWHGTLMVIAVVTIAILFNTFFAKKLPYIESFMLAIHVFGFLAILVPLWVLSPRQPAEAVFTEFTNAYGWPTQGLACLVGITGSVYSLLGADSAVHMAEETRDASRILPFGMMSALALNGTLGLVMIITFTFCIPDLDLALSPKYGFAYIDVFYNATQSKAGTSVMAAILTLMSLCGVINNVATASRQLYAFGRDKGVPFSNFFASVRKGQKIPLNAVLFCFTVTCLLSLINLGSDVAFNAIVSLGVGALLTSYIISISCVIIKRIRHEPLPTARWTLGRFGLPINIAAVCFLLVVFVFSFFSLAPNPTVDTMNWSCLLYGSVIIFSTGYFFVKARNEYKGPVVLIQRPEYETSAKRG